MLELEEELLELGSELGIELEELGLLELLGVTLELEELETMLELLEDCCKLELEVLEELIVADVVELLEELGLLELEELLDSL